MVFSSFGKEPDEAYEDDVELSSWRGDAKPASWQFLRYGDVYAGTRLVGSAGCDITGTAPASQLRRDNRNGFLRVELDLLPGGRTVVDSKLQELTDCACAFEIADRSECGSFEEFRRQCQDRRWEFYRWKERHSRYDGRNAELYISDSTEGELRFAAVDGECLPEPELIEATGLDPSLVRLFPDGRKIKLRRLLNDYSFAGSPFYKNEGRVFVHPSKA